MEARLVEFAGLLRHSGMRVSAGEVAEAGRALSLVGLSDEELCRAALCATLVKRSSDVPLFEELFSLYFSGLGRALGRLGRGLLAELEDGELLEGQERREAALALRPMLESLSPLARAALSGERGMVARLFERAAREIDFGALLAPSQVGFYGRRLFAAAGGGALIRDLAAVEGFLRARQLSRGGLEHSLGSLRAVLGALEDAARLYADLEQRARAQVRGRSRKRSGLFSAGDVERMEVAVRRLAERLKDRLSSRERAHRGALDVRRTLRRNMKLGGLPAHIAFRRRRHERPELLILCDVSDSVRNVSRLMLLFLHTLQGLFSRVRSFVFVSEMSEVTQSFLAERDLSRAAERATAAQGACLGGNSNYGRVLKLLCERHRSAITRRATVIIIGDGRNNYHPPNAWTLEEVRRRARRLLWICPEERTEWGQGDSEMPLYASKVERVAVVTTLSEMEGVADALIPRPTRH